MKHKNKDHKDQNLKSRLNQKKKKGSQDERRHEGNEKHHKE